MNNLFNRIGSLALILAMLLPFVGMKAGSAQSTPAIVRQVRAMLNKDTGLLNPAGLAFSMKSNAFYAGGYSGQAASAQLELVKLTPFADRKGSARITAAIQDPINMVFDDKLGRLLILQEQTQQLLDVRESISGELVPGGLTRYDIREFGLVDPQGMTVDPESGALFILDGEGPRIVRIEPNADGSFSGAGVREIGLETFSSLRGIAYEAGTGHLYVIEPGEQRLYELSGEGQVVETRDLSGTGLVDPQGMVFAPSGDQTDDPGQMNLYVADRGVVTSVAPKGNLKRVASPVTGTQSAGQIVELSLLAPAVLPSGVPLLPATLVQEIDTSIAAWDPSAPDTSGIDYWPLIGGLLVSDSEVDEMPPYFPPAYKNVFFSTFSGTQFGSCSTTNSTRSGFSNEPTGLAVNRNNNHIFFSDDDQDKIFEVSPGADSTYCTSDDVVTSMLVGNTTPYGIWDAEDIAYGNNTVYIAGGDDAEVYILPLGADGVLGGGDDGPMTSFDTASLGFSILEGLGYNWDDNTLILASPYPADAYIGVATTAGVLLRAYDFSSIYFHHREDVTIAPGSLNPSVYSLYVSDRGHDNDYDPYENDGKILEIDISGVVPTSTPTLTPTATPTATNTPTNTPTSGPSPTPTKTATPTATSTPAPTTIDFGDQLFRTSNAPANITITNTHGFAIHIGTLQGSSSVGTTWTSSKSFFIENDTCSGATLPAGANCTFDIRFLPWSLGAKSGTITIPSDAPDQPYVLSLSGNSIPGTQLLLNRSFENYSASTGLPNIWGKSPLFKIGLDGVDDSWAFHGTYSVKLVGDGDLKIFSQTVNKSGSPGDDFSFFVTTHAEGIPNDADRWLMQVMFYNGSTIVENRNVKLKTGTYDFKRITRTYTATTNYTSIVFRIHFGKSSGTAWVDLSSLQWAP